MSRNMIHAFQLLPFFAGIVAGLLIVFGLKPDTRERVVKWPHPNNTGKVVYRDRNGLCYTFEAQLADCATVKETLVTYAFE
jgi:hypothetical protein